MQLHEVPEILLLALTGFLAVFFQALQSRAVNWGTTWLILANGAVLGLFQMAVWWSAQDPAHAWRNAIIWSISGPPGSLAAVYVHRFLEKKRAPQ